MISPPLQLCQSIQNILLQAPVVVELIRYECPSHGPRIVPGVEVLHHVLCTVTTRKAVRLVGCSRELSNQYWLVYTIVTWCMTSHRSFCSPVACPRICVKLNKV